MAAPARTACWRMTLQANASSSGCGAISINLERISNVGAVKVRRGTLVNRKESKTAGNLIQLSGEVLPLDRFRNADRRPAPKKQRGRVRKTFAERCGRPVKESAPFLHTTRRRACPLVPTSRATLQN